MRKPCDVLAPAAKRCDDECRCVLNHDHAAKKHRAACGAIWIVGKRGRLAHGDLSINQGTHSSLGPGPRLIDGVSVDVIGCDLIRVAERTNGVTAGHFRWPRRRVVRVRAKIDGFAPGSLTIATRDDNRWQAYSFTLGRDVLVADDVIDPEPGERDAD